MLRVGRTSQLTLAAVAARGPSMVRRFIGSIAALLIGVLPAGATSITLGGLSVDDQGQFSTVVGATTVTFDALAGGTQDVTFGIASYNDVNIFSCTCSGSGDLLDDTTPGARALGGGSYSIDFSEPISYFGIYWGSPDPDNALTMYNGSTELFTFTGADLNALGVGYGTGSAAYVNFFASDPGDIPATRIVFSGGTFPFESDNHAFLQQQPPIPEPASLLLLTTGGLGLLGARRRGKRQR